MGIAKSSAILECREDACEHARGTADCGSVMHGGGGWRRWRCRGPWGVRVAGGRQGTGCWLQATLWEGGSGACAVRASERVGDAEGWRRSGGFEEAYLLQGLRVRSALGEVGHQRQGRDRGWDGRRRSVLDQDSCGIRGDELQHGRRQELERSDFFD